MVGEEAKLRGPEGQDVPLCSAAERGPRLASPPGLLKPSLRLLSDGDRCKPAGGGEFSAISSNLNSREEADLAKKKDETRQTFIGFLQNQF